MTTQTGLRIRQTHLRHLVEHCPAMAYALSVEGRDAPAGPGAERGSAVHEFFARYVEHLYECGRATDWDAVGEILAGVLADFPGLSFEQAADVRAQAERIAAGFLMRPSLYYGCEEALESTVPLTVGGEAVVTGRLDYLEVEGEVARIRDVKSNHQVLPDSSVKNDFQLALYAMLVLDNLPGVEVAEGSLFLTRYGITLPQRGKAVWTREDSQTLKDYLSVRLSAHFDGRLKAEHVPGVWCQYCPLRRLNQCTLYRSYYGTTPPPPLTSLQAVRLARQIMAIEERRETCLGLLKQYVNESGPLPVGSGDACEVFDFHKRESEEWTATALLGLLEANRALVGDQPLDEFLSVNKRSKAFKNLRYHRELRSVFDDAALVKVSTTFGHKKPGSADE